MNANAKKWVDALRSGNYLQGRGKLCTLTPNGETFCCLGVACELYGKEFPLETFDTEEGRGYDGSFGQLPFAVRKWLGLGTSTGEFRQVNGDFISLVFLNDRGWTFHQIASRIESEPRGLFVEASR